MVATRFDDLDCPVGSLILPFAGLEMLALGLASYVVSRRSAAWQAVEDAVIKGHPSRLIMASHGRNVEIGGCLNQEEKQALAVQLRRAVQLN